jgi:hypothetical protein
LSTAELLDFLSSFFGSAFIPSSVLISFKALWTAAFLSFSYSFLSTSSGLD